MADYYGYTRTSYFGVTNQKKFRQLMARCTVAGDSIMIFEQHDELDPTKVIKFGFGAYGSILGINEDCKTPNETLKDGCEADCCEDADYCHFAFCKALQELVAEGDAILIQEVGFEKLRYLVADTTIITRTEIRSVRMEDVALQMVRDMLGNPDFATQIHY